MKESLLRYLVCPSCRGTLVLGIRKQIGLMGEIKSGTLDCSNCTIEFPIREYIPRFVPSANYASSFGFEWKRHARTQLDKFSGTDITRQRFYNVTGWRDQLHGELIMEAGCGAGRFTEVVLKTGAEIVSFDYSEAVEASLENHGHAKTLHLLQADIYRIPLRDVLFDKVFCFGVLQHCPDVTGAFRALLPPLKTGGELAIDIYEKTIKVYTSPRYWLRLITNRMPPESLYKLIERSVPRLFPMKTWLKERIPFFGRYMAILIPIAYYKGVYPLSEQQHLEWSILDTFDILSPRYENRADIKQVARWFAETKMSKSRVQYGPNGIVGVGIKT